MDTDRRVLLWFSDEADCWAEQAAHRAVLERAWPGWEVRWAFDGLGDLHAYLGLGRGFVRTPGFRETGRPYWEQPDGDIITVLTAAGPGGESGAWASAYEVDDELSGGAGLLGLLPVGMPPPGLTAIPAGGLHFDLARRTLGVWTIRTVPGIHDWPLPGWEDWGLDFWGADHRRQAAYVAFPDDDPRPALRQWRNRIGDPPPDPAVLLALARQPQQGGTIVVNPSATVPHETPAPTAAERAALSAVFDTLLA